MYANVSSRYSNAVWTPKWKQALRTPIIDLVTEIPDNIDDLKCQSHGQTKKCGSYISVAKNVTILLFRPYTMY